MAATISAKDRVRYVLRTGRTARRGLQTDAGKARLPAKGCVAGVMQAHQSERKNMNQIIYIVGLVVIVIAILSFFGLR